MIGLLVRETILLRRAYGCEHSWEKTKECKEPDEEQCIKCTIVATKEGKVNLERATNVFYGRRVVK